MSTPRRKNRVILLAAIPLVILAAFIAFRLHGSVPPWIKTESDPISAKAPLVDLAHAPDFRFTFGEKGFSGKYNVVTIVADGTCSYIFRPSKSSLERREAHFQLDPVSMTDLRNLLAEIDFFRCKRSYQANIEDGTQRWIIVIASGIEKTVSCDNYFPGFEERLRTFVTDRIITPHTAEIAAATPAPRATGNP